MRGASVFTLSNKASDRLAAGVAADENSADRFAGPHFSGVSPQVASILASLETRATRIGSATLAARYPALLHRRRADAARSAPQRQFRGAARLLRAQHAAGDGLPVEPAAMSGC